MRSLILAACALPATALYAPAQNLLENGSFEQPVVLGRTSAGKGGSPAISGSTVGWASLIADAGSEGGKLEAGLTDEVARTGKQSLYVDFSKLTTPGRKAVLKTRPIAVKPSQNYRLSLWGRIDRKRPLTLDERRPQMWMEIRFLQEDQTTETGEPIAGSQFLPGEVIPGGPHPLRFVTEKWKESTAELVTPPDAAFVTITWYWLTPAEAGETDGTVYWDDAELVATAAPAKEGAPTAADPGAAAETSAAPSAAPPRQ